MGTRCGVPFPTLDGIVEDNLFLPFPCFGDDKKRYKWLADGA